jgi:hypothetical protein
MPATHREPIQKRPSPPLVDRELTLSEMLDDPIVVRLMRRDGVKRAEIMTLFAAQDRGWLCRAA